MSPALTLTHIFICPAARAPMQEVQTAQALAHVGLAGDRYAAGQGSWSDLRQGVARDVTLISAQAFAEANAQLGEPCTLADTRRNLVISGQIDLFSLIGRDFTIGALRLRGVETAEPCMPLERQLNRPGFKAAFQGRAGIRAEFLTSGELRVGDAVYLCEADVAAMR